MIVTITGGSGSLGHHLVKSLLENPKWHINNVSGVAYPMEEIRIVSRDEEKQWRMRHKFDGPLRFYIGDVRDKESLKKPFDGADIVIHAAALKQIDTCEYFPEEAIKTNVIGAENVCKVAEGRVQKCIAISTDKAVKPINAYGMTKGLQERIFTNWPENGTIYSVVRYGNVLGSRGSVVPLFSDLVKENKPLPITHKDMTRFWLNLDSAVELITWGVRGSKHGEIILPKMKASKITDLAEVMSDTPWIEAGLRPGEKIHEDILSEEESTRAYDWDQFIKIQSVTAEKPRYHNPIGGGISSNTVEIMSKDEIRALLQKEGWLQ